ncbi:MAG TPA: hypothetical protein V6D23_18210 [Candidatus Obscuribacterales bacterium]
MSKKIAILTGLCLMLAGPALAEGGRFGKLDANGDGKISLQEMQAQAEKHFTAADTNKDGQISQAEREQMAAAHAAKRQARMQAQGQQAQGQHKHQGQHRGQHKQGFKGPDANADGLVSRAEAQAAVQKRFTHMDLNHDGFVTQDELKQLQAQRKQRWQQRQQKSN